MARPEKLALLAKIFGKPIGWFQGDESVIPDAISARAREADESACGKYSINIPFTVDRSVLISNLSYDLTVREAKKIADVIMALADKGDHAI